jgi:hypothetical protein
VNSTARYCPGGCGASPSARLHMLPARHCLGQCGVSLLHGANRNRTRVAHTQTQALYSNGCQRRAGDVQVRVAHSAELAKLFSTTGTVGRAISCVPLAAVTPLFIVHHSQKTQTTPTMQLHRHTCILLTCKSTSLRTLGSCSTRYHHPHRGCQWPAAIDLAQWRQPVTRLTCTFASSLRASAAA